VEFDSVYNCHCSLRLATGREITLDKLSQSRAYSGLLEGTPNKASNDHSIQWALERAKQDNESLGEPFLVPPERRDYFREQGDMQSVLDRQHDRPAHMRHIPEWLPQIVCVGVFRSIQPARDKTKDASSLTIVWYQDDFGLDPQASERLRAVDWDQHATDWEY
jgi:hypothetical protein